MTPLKNFFINANGTPMGIYTATTEEGAVLAYAQDAGYETVAEAAAVLGQDITDWRSGLDVEEVRPGSVIAVSKCSDATFYDVVRVEGERTLIIRDAGTNYVEQTIDRSLVAQIKAA